MQDPVNPRRIGDQGHFSDTFAKGAQIDRREQYLGDVGVIAASAYRRAVQGSQPCYHTESSHGMYWTLGSQIPKFVQ